jgi:hypothetical protein
VNLNAEAPNALMRLLIITASQLVKPKVIITKVLTY